MQAHLLQLDEEAQEILDAEALENGALTVMPADFYRHFRQADLSGFCQRHGFYLLPTVELVELIDRLILQISPTRSAIEIGSGNGTLGAALDIPCTDSHMQNDPHIRALYELAGQPVTRYGAHVERLDALSAVERYRPEVVVGAWVTHIYDAKEHARGGNMYGVDEVALLQRVKRYIFVANMNPHALKPLLALPHATIQTDAIFSRGIDASKNALLVWDHV